MNSVVLFENRNLSGGYNTDVNAYLNKSNESREALGCDFNEVGSIKRVSGYETFGTGLPSYEVLGLYDFKTSTGTTKFLSATGGKIYSFESGTWTERYTSLNTSRPMTFATHLDRVIATNGDDSPIFSADGETWETLSGSPPKGNYVLTFNNSVYMLNLQGATSRIQWSDDGTISTWNSDNTLDVITNVGLGDQITGGAVNNNNLIIFKNYSTWKWDTVSLVTLNTNAGCTSPRSIATIDNWTFWLSHKGIMATSGGKPERISNAVSDFIEGITDLRSCVGWAENNFYRLYIGTSNGVSNCVLIYDFDNNVWSYESLQDPVKASAILTDTNGAQGFTDRSAYFGDDSGQIYKYGTGNNNNGAPIPFKWVSRLETAQYPYREKEFEYLYVFTDKEAKPGVDVYISIDYKDFQFIGNANKSTSLLRIPSGSHGHHIRISFQTNNTGEQQTIYGYMGVGKVLPWRLTDVG